MVNQHINTPENPETVAVRLAETNSVETVPVKRKKKVWLWSGVACLIVLLAAMIPIMTPVAASTEFPLGIVCWGVGAIALFGEFVCFGMYCSLTAKSKNPR